MKTRLGEAAASIIQSRTPLKYFETHLAGIACLSDNPQKQIPSHSWVHHINEDVMQGLIFDSDQSDARLIGIEYIITERLFEKLPEDEKKLWSSNAYPVKSGIIVAPRMPGFMEHRLMEDLAPTYSKKFITWDPNQPLPQGIPHLAMNPVNDSMLRDDVSHRFFVLVCSIFDLFSLHTGSVLSRPRSWN
jgi:hypothetical protein